MTHLAFTSLSVDDLRTVVREELRKVLTELPARTEPTEEQIGGIDLAMSITGLAKPTIYNLTAARKIPFAKRGKRLYFSRLQLIDWVKAGQRPLRSEFTEQAREYKTSNSKKD